MMKMQLQPAGKSSLSVAKGVHGEKYPHPLMAITICTNRLCKQTFLWVREWQKQHENTHIKGHKTSGIVLWLVTV